MSHIAILEDTTGRKRTWLITSWLGLVLAAQALPGLSQTVETDSTCVPISVLKIIPQREPRPAEGPTADQQWQVERTGSEREPVASFVDTLRGNDAAFEVIVGQGRLLTVKKDIAGQEGEAVIAVADPTIIDFEVLPNARTIRVIGKRVGVTDMSVITADGQAYSFEVRTVYELALLRAQLQQVFPDAHLKLAQLRGHVIVEGQSRSTLQVSQILQIIEAYLETVHKEAVEIPLLEDRTAAVTHGAVRGAEDAGSQSSRESESGPSRAGSIGAAGGGGNKLAPQIINLIRVPGVQQVMLQVQIAELNRTALREIGADILGVDPSTGNIWGAQIAGSTIKTLGTAGLGGLGGFASGAIGSDTTAFGIFPSGDWQILLRALRQNSLVSILAEPNLMAMSGHRASFLAGGQFPVPVPQVSGGITNSITIEFKDFGVQLDFIPYVLDDDTIRLSVTSEVSTIDFALGTTLVLGGDPVPGLNTRRTTTTVELNEGQTLTIAGLLQVDIAGRTSRIPGLGDLPYIGPMFSNTSHKRVEKELLVMVTPCLVAPMDPDQVPCLPTDDITDPNDLEFYFLNRIAGRTGHPHRSTTKWDNPLCLVELMELEQRCMSGPVGYSD